MSECLGHLDQSRGSGDVFEIGGYGYHPRIGNFDQVGLITVAPPRHSVVVGRPLTRRYVPALTSQPPCHSSTYAGPTTDAGNQRDRARGLLTW
jgi:hypothetical protein